MLITVRKLRALIREAMEERVAHPPDVLYHATSERNVQAILRNGLEPRLNWNTPRPAIFLIDDADNALDMYEMIGHRGRSELFKVHIGRLPKETTFYDDLDAGRGAYWTPDPIPASALEQIHLSE